jgi:hypothetical protein
MKVPRDKSLCHLPEDTFIKFAPFICSARALVGLDAHEFYSTL